MPSSPSRPGHRLVSRPSTGLGLVLLVALVAALALGQPGVAGAQEVLEVMPFPQQVPDPEPPASRSKAAFLEVYDDGEVDVFRSGGDTTGTWEAVMLFGGGAGVDLDGIDICFASSGDPDLRFDIVVWENDGAGGRPGTELASFNGQVTGLTGAASFSSHPVDYTLPTANVFIGIRMNPVVYPDAVLCEDRDGLGDPPRLAYTRSNEGAWNALTDNPDYDALMIRAAFSTPPPVLEQLYVPFFNVDVVNPGGTTTLFAVRNVTETPVTADIEYFSDLDDLQRTETVTLDPDEVYTRNLRDIPLESGGGFARGWVRVTTGGDPGGDPVLAGDYFQVDVDEDFATGEKMPRLEDLCRKVSTRFVNFGSGTKFRILLFNPAGADAFQARALNQNGDPVTSFDSFFASNSSVLLGPENLILGLAFGTVEFDFTNSGGGYVYAEHDADGRFSVGLGSECEEF